MRADGHVGLASIWPRRQRRGEPKQVQKLGVGVKLQFGHDVSVVENTTSRPAATSPRKLQFGHDVSVVENSGGPGQLGGLAALQFGHDVSVVENFACPAGCVTVTKSFNLATTSASWRTTPSRSPARGHWCFNLATTSASWRTTAAV